MKNKIFESLGYLSVIIGIIGVFTFVCTSCNLQTTCAFDRAIIQISNDEVIEIEVASWEDYRSNDKIEIKAKDGTTYLVHSSNVTLIHDES